MFSLYAQANEDWATVEFQIDLEHKEQTQGETSEDWFTESELVERYKDLKVVAGIVATKRLDPRLNRPHPDAPTVADATQYYCGVKDSSTSISTSTAAQKLAMKSEVAQSAPQNIMHLFSQNSTERPRPLSLSSAASATSALCDSGSVAGPPAMGAVPGSHKKPEQPAAAAALREKKKQEAHAKGGRGPRRDALN